MKIFDVQYKKELQKSFMIMPAIDGNSVAYLENMLKENPSNSRLAFHVEIEEAKKWYSYEISGLKTLEMTYKRIPLSGEDIKLLFNKLIDEIRNGKRFLLNENDYIVSPEYIYTDIPDYNIKLCCLPGYNVPLVKQLGEMLEIMLNHVDYNDDSAVELIYMLYMQTQNEDVSLKEFEFLLEKNMGRKKDNEQKIQMVSENTIEPTKGLFDRLKNKADTIFNKFMNEDDNESKKKSYGCEYTEPKKTDYIVKRENREYASLISERTAEEFLIEKSLYYIGSLKGYTDITVVSEGVSKFHASIRENTGTYFVKDLNSSNGTFVNENELIPEQEVLLKNGDSLKLGKEVFKFVLE